MEEWALDIRGRANGFMLRTWERGGWWRLVAVGLFPIQAAVWVLTAIATAIVGVIAVAMSCLFFLLLLAAVVVVFGGVGLLALTVFSVPLIVAFSISTLFGLAVVGVYL
jgi:hypothetical protein